MKTILITGIEPEYAQKLKDFLTEIINVNGQFAEYLALNGIKITQPELNQIVIDCGNDHLINCHKQPAKLDIIVDRILSHKDGFTIDQYGYSPEPAKNKYLVSLYGHEQKIEIRGKGKRLLIGLIMDYVNNKAELLKSPNYFLGGWVHEAKALMRSINLRPLKI